VPVREVVPERWIADDERDVGDDVLRFDDLRGRTFEVNEVSAYGYRVTGADSLGWRTEATGTDPQELLAAAREWARKVAGASVR
jgi:hypothetical protein